ncbi:MAG: hypothetical protein BM564_03580 [Bacteroidetes bacterium MedPE-SWsnd-G2]|nr:MAG: hypothetical protein BM564_03580 [Bacteroidetes bacterium MedPE-SWsnd-G2]
MKQLFSVILLLVTCYTFSQNTTIASGEKLKFSATYNMSGLLTELAEVTMETSSVKTSKTTLLRLKCTAATYSQWDGFFKIRDLYESYVSPKYLTPYLYKRDINEGGYYKFMQYKFSHKKGSVSSLKKKRNSKGEIYKKEKTIPISKNVKDIVTTIYHLRNLSLDQAKVGDSQTFKVLFDNIEYSLTISMMGKETISTAIGSKECYKLGLSINNSDVLKGSTNLLWLTADKNKIPVYAKFKIAVGNGELKIKSATGLKY